MKLLGRIDKLIIDTTMVGDVAQNKSQGNIDVIGGKCPNGMLYDKEKKTCVPIKNEGLTSESSTVGATYVSGNSTIAGSGQTRTVGARRNIIDVLKTKEPIEIEDDDKTKENLGRISLKFDTLLGAYVPKINIDNLGVDDG